jgi:hypothetical protein
MNKSKMVLIAGVAAIAFSGAAAAGAGGATSTWYNVVKNDNQLNYSTVYSHVDMLATWIKGDLRVTAAAIGNNLSADMEGNTYFYNFQRQLSEVGSTLKLTAEGVHGDVEASSVAICNNASLTSDKADKNYVYNDQRCGTLDPFAIASVDINGAGGVGLTAAAIGNNLAVDVVGSAEVRNALQVNVAPTYAELNATVRNATGDVTASAVAIGNNINVTSRFGTP